MYFGVDISLFSFDGVGLSFFYVLLNYMELFSSPIGYESAARAT